MPNYNYGNMNPYYNQGMQIPNYTYQSNVPSYMYPQQSSNYSYQQQPNSYMNNTSYAQDTQYGKPVLVHSEQEAKMYPVAKGDTVWMMDSDNMVLYFKSVDNAGMALPLRVYDITERQTNSIVPAQYSQISTESYPSSNSSDNHNYVTWDALNALETKVNELMKSEKPNVSQTQPTSGKRGNNA